MKRRGKYSAKNLLDLIKFFFVADYLYKTFLLLSFVGWHSSELSSWIRNVLVRWLDWPYQN